MELYQLSRVPNYPGDELTAVDCSPAVLKLVGCTNYKNSYFFHRMFTKCSSDNEHYIQYSIGQLCKGGISLSDYL